MGNDHQSAQIISAHDQIYFPGVAGVGVHKTLRSAGKHDLEPVSILIVSQELIGALISPLDLVVKARHLIGVVVHTADPGVDPVQAHIGILFVQDNSSCLSERFPQPVSLHRAAAVRSLFFDIPQFLLSIGVVDGRDLYESLDQVREGRDIFRVRRDHISADQDGVRRCVSGQIRDHAVSAFEDIAEEIGDHDKAERILSFFFLGAEIVDLRIIVGAVDHPVPRNSYDQSQYQ